MKVKKFFFVLLGILFLSAIKPVFAAEIGITNTEPSMEARAQQIESRLIEIRNLNKTNLTATEKKELRKEVKRLNKERKTNGVYLSVGAIIIIVILLLILLL